MTIAQNGAPTSHKPLRLWPGVALLILQWLLRFGLPAINPDAILVGMLGELVCGLGILIWWAFFSRVPRSERWGALLLIVVALAATWRLLDVSIATGMMGMMFPMFAIPVVCLALVLAAVAAQYLSGPLRRPAMAAVVLIACFMFALLRTNGIMGSVVLTDFAWRWSKTHEERLLARTDESAALPATPVSLPSAPATLPAEPAKLPSPPPEPAAVPALAETGAGWPGFRGPHRDSVIPGTRIATDWSQTPPTQLWRRPIGPGWSSFAVLGGYLYTQEQRGSDEIVACYRVTNGKPVWTHRDPARFWESNAGAGPRATPTLANGRLYTFGATGILNALDARNGAVIWSRNAAADTHIKVPGWGFASSPLVLDDEVVIAVDGKLAAYALATGEPRWSAPDEGNGYSSPHLATIGGTSQILLMGGDGAISVAPADGTVLWKYPWKSDVRIVQPALTPDGDILMAAGGGTGLRRLAVSHAPAGWTVADRWTSTGLKPYYNDFVVHQDHAFGFDGAILSCIDLKDGQRKWKGGRYGNGQLILLPDQDLLLVLSDEGELALVAAASDQFKEIARSPAIEGKTWNHPALAGDILLVRNGEEMAAFRLALAPR